jgi:hypothetical protein
MRVVCLADTHELHSEMIVPPGDLLLYAGDLTFFSKRPSMIDDFNDWLGGLPYRHKVITYGNHEFAFESNPGLRARLSNAIVLVNEGVTIDGVTIRGSPVTPMKGGAFGYSRAEDRARLYSRIPPETQILLTHTPPFGVLDGAPHAGCPEPRAAVIRLRPRLLVFGDGQPLDTEGEEALAALRVVACRRALWRAIPVLRVLHAAQRGPAHRPVHDRLLVQEVGEVSRLSPPRLLLPITKHIADRLRTLSWERTQSFNNSHRSVDERFLGKAQIDATFDLPLVNAFTSAVI